MTSTSKGDPACVFCAAAASDGADGLIVYRGATCFVILNLYPYNNGHVMVVPARHVGRLADLTTAELDEIMRLTRAVEMALEE